MNEMAKSVGHIKNGVFVKVIYRRNILRLPEPSLTIDKKLYDQLRSYFSYVRVTVLETNEVYGISAEDFGKLALTYDYGNGVGYRLEMRHWKLESKQLSLEATK